jgi:hypothetical protein
VKLNDHGNGNWVFVVDGFFAATYHFEETYRDRSECFFELEF